MLQLYIDLALSRLARHAIQPIQPIQLYSYTAIHAIQHTAPYSLPQKCWSSVGSSVERSLRAITLRSGRFADVLPAGRDAAKG